MIFVEVGFIVVRSVPEIKKLEFIGNITESISHPIDNLSTLGLTFEIIEMLIFIWFFVEYMTRLICSPNKKKFLLSTTSLIDIYSFIQFIGYLVLRYGFSLYNTSELMRCLRILILLKVTRYSEKLKIFGKALKESYKEIFVLLIYLSVAVVFFGSIVYYSESFNPQAQIITATDSYW